MCNPPFEATEEFKIMSKMSIFLIFLQRVGNCAYNGNQNSAGNLPCSTVITLLLLTLTFTETD